MSGSLQEPNGLLIPEFREDEEHVTSKLSTKKST